VTLFSESFHRNYICDIFTICQEREEDFTLFPEVFLDFSSFRAAARKEFLAASLTLSHAEKIKRREKSRKPLGTRLRKFLYKT